MGVATARWQVAHQSGWQLPYVPFIGLGIQTRQDGKAHAGSAIIFGRDCTPSRYAPVEERRALIFRNNRQNTLLGRWGRDKYEDDLARCQTQ